MARDPRLLLALCLASALLACGEPPPPGPPAQLTAADAEALLAEHAAMSGARETPGAESGARHAAEASLVLSARLLDESAQPLALGELAWLRLGEGGVETLASARSDRTGGVWLSLPRAELPAEGQLLLGIGGPGRARLLRVLDEHRWKEAEVVSLDEITLPPGGSIAGRVLDELGGPLAGAFVGFGPELPEGDEKLAALARVWPMLDDLGLGLVPPLASSGADGRYVLEGVPCGRFMVVAAMLPDEDVALLPEREPAVLVSAGAETAVRDLVLRRAGAGDLVTGTVLAPDGTPAEGAFVSLETDGISYPGGRTQSSSAGRFVLLAPSGLEFTLWARDRAVEGRQIRRPAVRAGDADLVLRFEDRAR